MLYPTYITSDAPINIKYNLTRSKNKKRKTIRKVRKIYN
jgi:hypothetical protein